MARPGAAVAGGSALSRAGVGPAVASAVVPPLLGLVIVLVGEPRLAVVVPLLLLSAVGGVAAVVLSRSADVALDELERSRTSFRHAVARLGDSLAASADREQLVGVVLDTTTELVRADAGVFWMDVGTAVVARAQRHAEEIGGRRLDVGTGIAGCAADRNQVIRWPDANDVVPSPVEPESGAVLAVPIKARGRLYGVLALYRSPASDPFTDLDLDDVIGLAHQAEAAIDVSFLHDETKRLSLTDGLTGLWNRRQFELRVHQELERAARFGERFSVVLVDLDEFKVVNDTHGHLVGDAVLVETSRRLVEHTREVDVVARYGGEEFVLLLPQTDLAGARLVADKVRREVSATPVDTEVGPLDVTLSAGVSCHPEHGGALGALLAAADEALYAAKAAGKNRVASADVPEGPGVAP